MSRSTGILLATAILLSVWVYFFESSPAPWERGGKVFRNVNPSEIREIAIARPMAAEDADVGVDVRPIRLRLDGEQAAWYVVEPIRCRAFHPRVMSIVYQLADLARLAEAAADTEAFPRGPEIVVRMKTSFGVDATIEIGREHPDASLNACYVRVGDDVFVASREFRRAMTVALEELRSRALVPIAPPDAVALAVTDARAAPGSTPGSTPEGGGAASGFTKGGFAKRIERVGDSYRWRLREPIDALADKELTEALLTDLNSWTVAGFVVDDAKGAQDLEPYGLDAPEMVVTVAHRSGRSVAVEIGKEYVDSRVPMVYVRHSGEPFVYSAKADVLDRLRVGPEDLRSRFVFEVGLEDIVAFDLVGEGNELAVRGLWRRVSPGGVEETTLEGEGPPDLWDVTDRRTGQTFPGDGEGIGILVAEARKLTVQKFLGDGEYDPAAAGLSPPRARLTVVLTSGERLDLGLGAVCEDPDLIGLRLHHAARSGEPGAYLLQTTLLDALRDGAAYFFKRDLSDLDFTDLLEFEVIDEGRSWYLARVPGEPWMLSMDTPMTVGKGLDIEIVDQLIRRLDRRQFHVDRFLKDREVGDLAEAGVELSRPRRAIVLSEPSDLRGFRKLVLGARVPESVPPQVYARVDLPGVPPFTLVEDGLPTILGTLVDHLRDITGK